MKPDEPRYGRINERIDVRILAVKRTTILGAGSMGQPISSQLARHGVAAQSPGRIRIIDGDAVNHRNLIGTDYRLEHLRMPKVAAAANIIREIDDRVNVSYWNRRITEHDIPEIINLAKKSDLLCLAADSFELMLDVSDKCKNICPQVMAIFGPNADYAEVAFSLPGITPPLSRTLGNRKRQKLSKPTALGCDTVFISSFVTAVCLQILLGSSRDNGIVTCYGDAPLFVIGLRKVWLFANQPNDVTRTVICVKSN